MAIINLGLQSVGLSRKELSSDFERLVAKCNSMADLHKMATQHSGFDQQVMDSITPTKVILSDITCRLQLKDQQFAVGISATSENMDDLWKELSVIDPDFKITHDASVSAKDLTPRLVEMFHHCCRERHYFFEVKKCGEAQCSICRPARLPPEVFVKLHHMPDPIPGNEGHYKPFDDILGTETTEEHRPSLKTIICRKTLPFVASIQHVKNVEIMLCCDECGMWRLIYSK